jgi:hypothetical protein
MLLLFLPSVAIGPSPDPTPHYPGVLTLIGHFDPRLGLPPWTPRP